MDYKNLDFENFSDWKLVIEETHKLLSLNECEHLLSYINAYHERCMLNNGSSHQMPKSFRDASDRLKSRIEHLDKLRKSPIDRYVVPLIAAVVGAIVGSIVTIKLGG